MNGADGRAMIAESAAEATFNRVPPSEELPAPKSHRSDIALELCPEIGNTSYGPEGVN